MINLREQHGRGAFPDETPWYLKRKNQLLSVLPNASPVPLPPVLGDTVLYLDLSKWNWPMDFAVAYARGIRIVFIKVSQGAWVDSRFYQLVQAAIDAGMLVGFYHFIDPTQTSVSPEEAAEQAARLTKGVGHLSMWMDVEWRGNLDAQGLLNYLIRWHDAYKSIDDRMIEVYTRHSFFTTAVARSSFWHRNSIGLNSARYHLGLSSPWSDGYYRPADWQYTLDDFDDYHWQYLADGNGLGSYFGSSGAISIDLNLFRGTWNDLLIHYGLIDVPPIDPPENGECLWNFECVKRVRYRTQPITQPQYEYGFKDPGQTVEAKSVVIPNGYEVWLEFEEDEKTYYTALVHWGTKFYEKL